MREDEVEELPEDIVGRFVLADTVTDAETFGLVIAEDGLGVWVTVMWIGEASTIEVRRRDIWRLLRPEEIVSLAAEQHEAFTRLITTAVEDARRLGPE